jgi:hypothetical protein
LETTRIKGEIKDTEALIQNKFGALGKKAYEMINKGVLREEDLRADCSGIAGLFKRLTELEQEIKKHESQDLWTYDFRRTEMCVIPYGTQEGEISFCAYNTGLGWRQIVENLHKTASLAEWHRSRGKHEIYAKGRSIELTNTKHDLVLPVMDSGNCCGKISPDRVKETV